MNNRIIQTVLLCVMSLSVSLAGAQTSPLLDNHRWQEYSYGVSILPPLGATVRKGSADQAIVRILAKDGYAINLFIKKSHEDMTLNAVRSEALEQMAGAYPSAIVLQDKIGKSQNRNDLVLHFYLPRTKRGAWVTAQSFVPLSPRAFVLFQLETPKKTYDLAKPVYEAVINSLQVTDPRQLLAERDKLLNAGHDLLAKLPFGKLKARLIPEQWFRFVEGDHDIGYMRIRQSHGRLDERNEKIPAYVARVGCKIQVMARMQIGDRLYDSVNVCYVSDERDEEIWSIRSIERPRTQRKVPKLQAERGQHLKFDVQEVPVDYQNSWVETGLMSHKKIQLNRHNPSSDKQFEWDVPPKAYLTQADLYLLPLLLRDQPDGTWGFYAYHPNSGKISFRTERLEHKSNGHYLIHSRLTPEDVQEQVTEYDEQGRIVVRVLAGGRKLIPAQRYEIERLWPQFVK